MRKIRRAGHSKKTHFLFLLSFENEIFAPVKKKKAKRDLARYVKRRNLGWIPRSNQGDCQNCQHCQHCQQSPCFV